MQQKVLLIFIFSVIYTLSFAQTANDYFQKGLDKYVRYQEEGIEQDIPGAIMDFSEALSLASDSSDLLGIATDSSLILMWRATAKSELEDYRGAIIDYKKAIKKGFGRNIHIQYIRISENYVKIKKYEEAIRFLNKAIEHGREFGLVDPSSPVGPDISMARAFFNRGILKIRIGNKEEGCLDLSKAGEIGYEDAYKAIREHCDN